MDKESLVLKQTQVTNSFDALTKDINDRNELNNKDMEEQLRLQGEWRLYQSLIDDLDKESTENQPQEAVEGEQV